MGSKRINNPLGVMQGRLVPKYKGRYQAHPVGYWQSEFPIAARFGLDCIEFILDYNEKEKNPLLSKNGIFEIKEAISSSGVKVLSICADYFIEAPLFADSADIAYQSEKVLYQLIKAANALDIRDIVIPCVDQASIQNKFQRERLKEVLSGLVNSPEVTNVNLALETDLDPKEFGKFLEQLPYDSLTVNYDIGNSASFGYNYYEELNVYGDRISNIHIKDRLLHGRPVKMGTGNANIVDFFNSVDNYDGPLILQMYRDDEGINIFKEQLDWLKKQLGFNL